MTSPIKVSGQNVRIIPLVLFWDPMNNPKVLVDIATPGFKMLPKVISTVNEVVIVWLTVNETVQFEVL